MKIGNTFFLERLCNKSHLYIIIGIDHEKDEAIAVNITEFKVNLDTSCVLNIGDHPFIIKKSIISYRDIETFKYSRLKTEINLKDKRDDVSCDLLKRIISGVLKSDQTPKKYKTYFKKLIGDII